MYVVTNFFERYFAYVEPKAQEVRNTVELGVAIYGHSF